MFEQLDERLERDRRDVWRRYAPYAPWLIAFFAFALGFGTGKAVFGARPFDWTVDIWDLVFSFCWTIGLCIAVARRLREKTPESH